MKRNSYGELILSQDTEDVERNMYKNALKIIKNAVLANIVPESYDNIEFDRKRRASGSALHHEIYDINEQEVLLCIRKTEGNKYGVSTISKDYVILSDNDIKNVSKYLAAKYAKASIKLGEAIELLKLKG